MALEIRIAAIIFLLAVTVRSSELDPQRCKALGFTGEAKCSDCEALREFVKDGALVDECKTCCIQDDSTVQYVRAELEVCPIRLNGLPELKHFIEKQASKYEPTLSITFEMGALPQLRLQREDGSLDTLRVDSWKRATFDEFMQGRLRTSSALR